MSPISIFACEPQPIVIEGLRKVLEDCEDLKFAGAVTSSNETLDAVSRLRPDIALIDLSSSGLPLALRLVAGLRVASPGCHAVLWVNELREMEAFRAFQMGVRGVLKKTHPIDQLTACLRDVGAGRIWMDASEPVTEFLQRKESSRLTPREKEVVRLICRGMKNKQIAEDLHITSGTVKVHLMHIFEKTGLQDRLALAVHGRELVGVDGAAG
ncbi:MAG TPA: response regulator transcription factor [Bryobacteraceae bacterium]|nr:response regulator transcription factor [Bryobacteraceae bacterium]